MSKEQEQKQKYFLNPKYIVYLTVSFITVSILWIFFLIKLYLEAEPFSIKELIKWLTTF